MSRSVKTENLVTALGSDGASVNWCDLDRLGSSSVDASVIDLRMNDPDVGKAPLFVLNAIQRQTTGRIYFITEDAKTTPTQSAVWGMGRCLYSELADRNCVLIDTSKSVTDLEIAREILTNSERSEVFLSENPATGSRLVACTKPLKHPALRLNGNHSYLVTGGLGGLGRKLVAWLADHGARMIIVTTRKMPQSGDLGLLQKRLSAKRCELKIEVLDITEVGEICSLIKRYTDVATPIAGVFHLAGMTADTPVMQMRPQQMQEVLEGKAISGLALERAFKNISLDYFVMFSSISALVGNPGQANYAAANAILDAIVWRRRHAGLTALSVNFGPVSGVGMAANPILERHLRTAGLRYLSPDDTFSGLGWAIQSGLTQVVISAPIDLERWARFDPRTAGSYRLSWLMAGVNQTEKTSKIAVLLARGDSQSKRMSLVQSHIVGRLSRLLDRDPLQMRPNKSLGHLGLDSLSALELQMILEEDFGVHITLMTLISDVTITEISTKIFEKLPYD